jgi:hypothetical protein
VSELTGEAFKLATDALNARSDRVELVERWARAKKITVYELKEVEKNNGSLLLPRPPFGGTDITVAVNGARLTEPAKVFPSEHMIAQIALGIGAE